MSERVVKPAAPRPRPGTYPDGARSALKSTWPLPVGGSGGFMPELRLIALPCTERQPAAVGVSGGGGGGESRVAI